MRLFAQLNCVVEASFTSTVAYADPYIDADVDVTFSGPDGKTVVVPAYWAGDSVWKMRFAAPVTGEYRYETRCSHADDSGLHGQMGTIRVLPYAGANQLLRHGRLRVAEDRRHFEHADGTPFFWIGDTWWMGLTTRIDWPHGFQALAADRTDKGFNVVQIVAGPYPDMDAWDARGRNEAGFPFEDGFSAINPAYYDHADLKIAHLVQSGLIPCIVGMWGYYLRQIGLERVKRFWRYLVARYGAYPVVWCLCGEGTMPYYLSKAPKEDAAVQKRGWSEVMAAVRQIDGHHNLITIHPTQYGREQVEDPSLMDFEMLQTGHSDMESVAPTAQTVTTAVGREPRMPIVNAEVNYEGILGRAWQNVVRLCFYGSALNGAAGFTYGANGIWQACTENQPYGPSPHGRCWGNTAWQDAMHLPGSRQVGLGGALMRRFPWWELETHPEWLAAPPKQGDPYASISVGIPGRLRIIYVPMLWDPPAIHGIEQDPTYHAYYFDPTRGINHEIGAVEPDSEGCWRPPVPPEVHDWLLVLETPA